MAVVGAGGSLGMILHGDDWQPLVTESFEGLVVEVDVAGLDVGRQGGRIDGEPMVLSRDLIEES